MDIVLILFVQACKYVVLPAILVGLFLAVLTIFENKKRNLDITTIIPEYDAPDGLSAAEIGYIYDSKVGYKEQVATLFDLEQRKVVELTGLDSLGYLTYKTLSSSGGLKNHEQLLFNHGNKEKSTSVNTVSTSDFKKALKGELGAKGFVLVDRFELVYTVKRALLAQLLITLCYGTYFTVVLTSGSESGLETAVQSVILLILLSPVLFFSALIGTAFYNAIVGHPAIWAQKLKQVWPKIEGFKLFVSQVELQQIKFESAEVATMSKNKTISYAIALGLKTDWQKRFNQ
jgi:Predicted membrane protein (DUF2207)